MPAASTGDALGVAAGELAGALGFGVGTGRGLRGRPGVRSATGAAAVPGKKAYAEPPTVPATSAASTTRCHWARPRRLFAARLCFPDSDILSIVANTRPRKEAIHSNQALTQQ